MADAYMPFFRLIFLYNEVMVNMSRQGKHNEISDYLYRNVLGKCMRLQKNCLVHRGRSYWDEA